MPPLVIDLRSAEDTRDVVHRAVQALAEGKLVAFPTETFYSLTASALSEDAIARLVKVKAGELARRPLTMAIKSVDEAADFVPEMGPLAVRLARRCWPGPVTLMMNDQHPDSALRLFSRAVQDAIAPAGVVSLRVPAHPVFQDVLRLLPGPVVMTSAGRGDTPDALSAEQVVKALNDDVQLVIDDGRSRFAQSSSVVRVENNRLDVVRQGVVSEQTLKRLSSMMIAFVCTGNTCRSPMAEALCRGRIAKRLGVKTQELEDRGVIVLSAGIAAAMGGRPSPEAVKVMAEHGLDLSNHESQPLTEQLARNADLLLVMTRSHRQAILAEWPETADRVHLLCKSGQDVADPVGGPVEVYRRCAEQISAEVDAWADELPLG